MEEDQNKHQNIDIDREHRKEPDVSDSSYNQSKLKNLIVGHDGQQAALEHEMAGIEADDVGSTPAQGQSLQVHGGLALN